MKKTIPVWLLAIVAGSLAFAGGGGSGDAEDATWTATSAFDLSFHNSGLSDATMHLLMSTQDYLQEPWEFSTTHSDRGDRHTGNKPGGKGLEQNLLWTQLGNTSAANTFGAAWLGRCKKGFVGAQVAYGQDHHDFSDRTDGGGFFTSDGSWDKDDAISASVAYGWNVSEKVALGVGLNYIDGRSNSSSRSESDVFSGSAFQDVFERTDTGLTFGAKFLNGPKFTWAVFANVSDASVDSYTNFDSLDTMGMVTDSSTFALYDLDGTSYGVGANFNFYPREDLDFRVSAYYQQADYNLNNTAVDFDTNGGVVTSFNNVTGSDITQDASYLSGTVAWHQDALHFYSGVSIAQWNAQTNWSGDFGDPMSNAYLNDYEIEYLAVTPSVAALYEINHRVAFIAGASFNWSDEDEEDQFEDVISMTRFRQENGWSGGDAIYRAGIEFRNGRFVADIGLGETERNGAEAVSTDFAYVSVRIGLGAN